MFDDDAELDDGLPLCFAVVADPMEVEGDDGSREYEIMETDIFGVIRDGMFVVPFGNFLELQSFLEEFIDYIGRVQNGTADMEEILGDE